LLFGPNVLEVTTTARVVVGTRRFDPIGTSSHHLDYAHQSVVGVTAYQGYSSALSRSCTLDQQRDALPECQAKSSLDQTIDFDFDLHVIEFGQSLGALSPLLACWHSE
jgi:hypothetical protein